MAFPSSHYNGSSSCVVEMQDLPSAPPPLQQTPSAEDRISPTHSVSIELDQGHRLGGKDDEPIEGTLPSPTTAVEQVQRWNYPRVNTFRTFACFWGFIIMGANDAALGALIPYLETYYDLSYTIISLVFLSPLIGYTASALLNNTIHLRLGQRGVAVICSLCHLAAYAVAAAHPPYPVLIAIYVLAGFGNGLEDAAWNAWVGTMANANEVLGILHGCYGLGATIAPLLATTMVTKAHWPWYTFYYCMVGFALLELLTSTTAFWTSTATLFRQLNPRAPSSAAKGGRLREALFTRPSARVTWICTLFLVGYMGVEVALGGWIVVFMMRERGGGGFASGMVATGFWMGMTVGRVVLGFVTPRVGERRAMNIYIPLALTLQLLFWLVPQFYVSAVAVGLLGFFLGPLFPAAVVAVSRLLPRHLHVSALGFATAWGGCGAAAFPFAVGAIAQVKGVKVLQPIVVGLLAGIWGVWLWLPRVRKEE